MVEFYVSFEKLPRDKDVHRSPGGLPYRYISIGDYNDLLEAHEDYENRITFLEGTVRREQDHSMELEYQLARARGDFDD